MKKSNKGQVAIWIAIVVIVLLIGGVFFYVSESALGTKPEELPAEGCPDSAATVSFSASDALDKSSSPTDDQLVRVDGGVASTPLTSYPVGANLQILWNATGYESAITEYLVPCGGGTITAELYDLTNGTLKIYNSDHTAALTDDARGGAQNQTVISSSGGGNVVLDMKLSGTNKDSTGDTLVTIELSNTTGCKNPIISGMGGVTDGDVPGFYNANKTNARVKAFNMPRLDGATEDRTGTLTIEEMASAVCCGPVFIKAYQKQAFEDVDADGTFKIGIEDSEGNEKYEEFFKYDFYIDCS